MNNKFKFILLPILLILLIAASSFDFSSQKLLEEKTSLTAVEPGSTPVIAELKEQKEQFQPRNFKLEEKLVNREEIDDYVVETYREYEVYTDSQGNVTESVPTSNYNYIRYYKD